MARDLDPTARDDAWPTANPWPLLLAGLAATGVALGWRLALRDGDAGAPWRFLLVVLGLLAAGVGVSGRLHAFREPLAERLSAAYAVLAAALVVLLASQALAPAWDTLRLLLYVGLGVALAGAVLLVLPRGWRMLAVSLVAVFHFAGILTAVLSIPPPFLVNQLWTRLFRYHLEFAYLNNAYHFYSPEPGPASLLWFRVEYDDGSYYWHKMPEREDYATRLGYQRGLSLTELASITPSPGPVLNAEEYLLARRQAGSHYQAKKNYEPEKIPLANGYEFPLAVQRREIAPRCKEALQSYVRYVARKHPHPDPAVGVRNVKIYRIEHTIAGPADLRAGMDPLDPRYHRPYYHGTFRPDGQLLNKDGRPLDPAKMPYEDPFLYWYLPILENARLDPPLPDREPLGLIDCLHVHAGDTYRPAKPQAANGDATEK
jgi:hypothetical protein